jgi:hypothetical protein
MDKKNYVLNTHELNYMTSLLYKVNMLACAFVLKDGNAWLNDFTYMNVLDIPFELLKDDFNTKKSFTKM